MARAALGFELGLGLGLGWELIYSGFILARMRDFAVATHQGAFT